MIATSRDAAMRDVAEVEAVPGRGLRGDRYFEGTGTFSGRRGIYAGAREVSLIAAGAIETCSARLGLPVGATLFRRNLVVAGLDLRALLQSELIVDDVRLEIVSTCPPCSYLTRKAGIDVKAGLAYIGGVRAKVVAPGMLRAGAEVVVASDRKSA